MQITLEGNIDDDTRDLIQLLRDLNSIHATHKEPVATCSIKRWALDLRQCRYLGPWAVAVICAAFLDARRLNHGPRVRLPTTPLQLKAFCVFSGMAQMFGGGQAPDPEHPECETIPVEQFHTASWDRSNRIVRLLQRHTELSPDTEDQIRTCVQEITQNIVDHAESAIGGVMSARYMAQSQEVRVGMVDHGVGIAARLRKRFPDTTTVSVALERVIQGGFSSQSRPNNMGLGVSNLFALVRSAGGRMALFTDNGVADTRPGTPSPQIRGLDWPFPGTGVFFSLPVRTA